ncbi:MAG TPA: PP2C family protein-serine/threonine phosphatase, partial [Thermoanaerobaculia bacterium]|nr:PP2C family protein-serine/threonine phosphatase [Thermoanaerobaculia bacterium]
MRFLFIVALALVDLGSGWRYTRVAPRDTPPPDDAAWEEVLRSPRQHEVWYRVPLPSPLPPDPQLVFRSYGAAFDVFVDAQRVYSFRDPSAAGRMRLHTVPIPPGRHLYVRVPQGSRLPVLGGIPIVASRDTVPRALVRTVTGSLQADMEDVAVGAILIVVGIASAAISRVRRGKNASALQWFGVFCALYGLRLIADSSLPLLLGASTLHVAYAVAWITYVITIPGWLMARSLVGDGWRSSLRWQVLAFAVFAPIGIVTGIVTGEPHELEPINNALVVIGAINILANLVITRKAHTRELRVVMIGSFVFLGAALLNNAAALLNRDVDETPGFLVFVACLGYAAVRTFTRGERARVELAQELATARDIQRSILPTSMPSVEGLRFAARYEPASSVAGDLFDFVAVDSSRCGVIVADVAGHGVPAALIASMVKVAVSSHARLADDPAALLHELNATLRRDVRRNFVTATYLWFSADTVMIANAGHPPPLLVRGDEVRELGPYGVLLGRFAVTAYEPATVALLPGDRIAAYTDGVIEARNTRGEAFGEERLHALLRNGATPDAIVEEVLGWRAGDADDLTVVIVDVAPASGR